MHFDNLTYTDYLFLSACFFFLVQLFYFVFFFSRMVFHKENFNNEVKKEPISIVIAARSEAHNLVEFLPYIFNQNYPEFQVVVVNDRSWDDTKDILKAFQQKYNKLHIVTIDENNHTSFGKKMAITLGIKGAKYENIVVTDADCKPVSENWLNHVNAAFASADYKEIVLGYSPYMRLGGFLNKLVRFDGFWIALQYFSFAKAGIPYMGVGRNMAYKKGLFFKIGGFKKHYVIKSGDDDLFIQQAGSARNTAVMIHPDSHIQTLPKTTWEHWVHQKKRHFTTAPHYKFSHRLLLGLWTFSLLGFYTLSIASMVLNKFFLITLVLLIVRSLLLIVTFTRAGRWLGQKDVVWFGLFFELIFLFIYPFIWLYGKTTKSDKWN